MCLCCCSYNERLVQPLKIIVTADGSHSLLNVELNETYHSSHGALQESRHVFIKNGLDFFVDKTGSNSIHILEVGFGTGLNALLTALRAQGLNKTIHYTSLEAFPLQKDVWVQLNYADKLGVPNIFNDLHGSAWDAWVSILPNFKLLKQHDTLQHAELLAGHYDVIYYDAFAPNKQPEMWDYAALKKITQSMKFEGVFVTYCAKGQLKRDLKSLGLTVQTLAGPPGKKEMVRGLKSDFK